MGSQASFEMFKRYLATHVNRHFMQLHTYNVALTAGLRGAYTWSHVASKFPPSTAWVLMQCRSICGNSAAPQVPTRMWQRCAGCIYAVRGLWHHFSIIYIYIFFFLILILLIQCLWTFKHIKTYKKSLDVLIFSFHKS